MLFLMKRSAVFASCFTVLLVGCSQPTEELSMLPDEVLRNASQVSLELEAVRYNLTGNFEMKDSNDNPTTGTLKLEGILQDAGEQLQFSADINANTKYLEGDSIISATIDVIVAGPEDLYVHLERYDIQGANQFFNPALLKGFSGIWWKVPSRENQVASASITPSPRILHAQAQVVTVVRDKGAASLRERRMYHYDIAIDPDKMVSYLQQVNGENGEQFDEASVRSSLEDLDATGEIWIDAETFAVHRLRWDILQQVTDAGQQLGGSFTVDFTDHNNAPDIVPPADAQEFSPFMFLDAPNVLEPVESTLPADVQDDIIRQLLEEGADTPYIPR
jgi:hypothetical protein